MGLQCPCCKSTITNPELNVGAVQLIQEYMENIGGWEIETEPKN